MKAAGEGLPSRKPGFVFGTSHSAYSQLLPRNSAFGLKHRSGAAAIMLRRYESLAGFL